jgi:ABC-2 type transport system permease protein
VAGSIDDQFPDLSISTLYLRFPKMIQVLSKEFNSFLNSLIAYVVIGVFLTAIGLLMWVFPETSVLEYGYADMEALFSLGPYVLIFLIPAITMRSFAEESRGGTLELLMTKPLTDWDIVVGKFLASLFLVILSLLPTLIYYFSVYRLGNPPGNIDTPGVMGSYIGLILLGAVFCSIGIFSSSITNNQIVSFILAAFLCYLMFAGFESISLLNVWSEHTLFIRELGLLYHYDALSRGLIDSRNLVYFGSVITAMLLITRIILGSRSW